MIVINKYLLWFSLYMKLDILILDIYIYYDCVYEELYNLLLVRGILKFISYIFYKKKKSFIYII